MKNDSNLFYMCSLIEYIGRTCKLQRRQVINYLGEEYLKRIYKYADVLHCEPIEKVADDYIRLVKIPMGDFDNVKSCKYEAPDYWTIGKVFERLIEDIGEDNTINTLIKVYSTWISDAISNYNSDFYYQSREYIYQCYLQGEIV